MVEMIINFFIYSVAMLIGIVALVLTFAFCLAFYKVYIKKDVKIARLKNEDITPDLLNKLRDLFAEDPQMAMHLISQLPEDQQKLIVEEIKRDNRQWISLDVEKNGDVLYFYDLNDSNGKFLFQCKTYEEMIDNLEKIRGGRGVRIGAELVSKLEMEDFFIKPGTKTDEPL